MTEKIRCLYDLPLQHFGRLSEYVFGKGISPLKVHQSTPSMCFKSAVYGYHTVAICEILNDSMYHAYKEYSVRIGWIMSHMLNIVTVPSYRPLKPYLLIGCYISYGTTSFCLRTDSFDMISSANSSQSFSAVSKNDRETISGPTWRLVISSLVNYKLSPDRVSWQCFRLDNVQTTEAMFVHQEVRSC